MSSRQLHDNLSAYVATTGARITPENATPNRGCTLSNATTYYFPIPVALAGKPLVDIHAKWAAAVVAVFTIEVSDMSTDDVTDYDATAGNWQQYNPPSAYVPVSGGGNTSSAATVNAGGANAGSAVWSLSDVSALRLRLKVVVTTGGLVRVAANGKVY